MVDRNGGGLGCILAWAIVFVLCAVYGPGWFEATASWLHKVTA